MPTPLGNFLRNALPSVVGMLPIPGAGAISNVVGNLLNRGGGQNQPSAVSPPPFIPEVVPPPVYNAPSYRDASPPTSGVDISAMLKQYWYVVVGGIALLYFMKSKKSY